MNNSEFKITDGVLTSYNGSNKNVIVPDSVRIIGECAFRGNMSIISVSLPESVVAIEKSAFMHCHSLKDINLPEGLIEIGFMAFCCCLSLESITLPNNLKRIGGSAFDSCYLISDITIPNGITEIKSCTFQYCKKLKNVSLPDRLTFIGEGAFRGCHSLKKILLPASLNKIDNRAFAGCKKLSQVTFAGNKPAFGENPFVNTPYESGCYIATCVYGTYDCKELWVLRRFRDKTLSKNVIGRIGINIYYKISPYLVKALGNNGHFKKMSKNTLDTVVEILIKKGYSSKVYTDAIWNKANDKYSSLEKL